MLGDDIKGADKDGVNGVVPWDAIYISGTDCATIWERKLGGDGRDVELVGRFPSSDGLLDHGNDGSAYEGRRVGVSPGGWYDGGSGDMANQGIHPEATGKHHGTSVLLENL